MIVTAVAAFVGAFSALAVLAEIASPPMNKALRYFVAFVVGILVAILLALVVQWVAGMFGRVG